MSQKSSHSKAYNKEELAITKFRGSPQSQYDSDSDGPSEVDMGCPFTDRQQRQSQYTDGHPQFFRSRATFPRSRGRHNPLNRSNQPGTHEYFDSDDLPRDENGFRIFDRMTKQQKLEEYVELRQELERCKLEEELERKRLNRRTTTGHYESQSDKLSAAYYYLEADNDYRGCPYM